MVRKGCAYVGRGGATYRRARCQGADKRQEKTGRKEKACCEEGSRKEGSRKEGSCQEGEGELGHSRPHRPADVKPMGYDIWPSSRVARSEERRGGKEGVSTSRSRWSP